MYDVTEISKLIPIPREAQVRIIYKDLNKFLAEASALEQYKTEFFKFKVKMDFENHNQVVIEQSSSDDIVEKWLESIDNIEVKAELTNEFKNLCTSKK
jgi:hypothetical protein